MNTELWVDADAEVHMVGHGFHLDELGAALSAHVGDDGLQS